MKLQPANRHILFAECQDPREPKSEVVSEEGLVCPVLPQDPSIVFGIVEAIDMEPPTVYPCAVGDVIYFPAAAAKKIGVDDGIFKGLIHSAQIFGVCKDADVKKIESQRVALAHVSKIIKG